MIAYINGLTYLSKETKILVEYTHSKIRSPFCVLDSYHFVIKKLLKIFRRVKKDFPNSLPSSFPRDILYLRPINSKISKYRNLYSIDHTSKEHERIFIYISSKFEEKVINFLNWLENSI